MSNLIRIKNIKKYFKHNLTECLEISETGLTECLEISETGLTEGLEISETGLTEGLEISRLGGFLVWFLMKFIRKVLIL